MTMSEMWTTLSSPKEFVVPVWVLVIVIVLALRGFFK